MERINGCGSYTWFSRYCILGLSKENYGIPYQDTTVSKSELPKRSGTLSFGVKSLCGESVGQVRYYPLLQNCCTALSESIMSY